MILINDETMRKFLDKTVTFNDYQEQYDNLENIVKSFVYKLKNRILKKKQIIKRFIQNIKYKNLIKNVPCNELDLYTLEKYDKNNKNNIYLTDIKLNKKWWFCIETITKLLCNNLSQFDGETYDIICKMPINPYTNKPLSLGQLTSIYDQLNKKINIQKLIKLFRMVNFSVNKFLILYNDDIINYSYKYNLESIDNEGILTILYNLLHEYKINYVDVNKLDLSNSIINNKIKQLIKDCSLTYKKNQVTKIKKFIDQHRYIIRRASRNSNVSNNINNINNNINNNNIEVITNIINNSDIDFSIINNLNNNSDFNLICDRLNIPIMSNDPIIPANIQTPNMELDFDEEESLSWTTDEDEDEDEENINNICLDLDNLNTD